MKKLNKIREVEYEVCKRDAFVGSLLILILGIILGVFAKALDNTAIDSTIWWHRILEVTNLNNVLSELPFWILMGLAIAVHSSSPKRAAINVFLFFVGMNASYHLYSVLYCGFNPFEHMKLWYLLSFISPLIAYIVWYAKGNTIYSILISSIVFAVMLSLTFGIGIFYFHYVSVINSLLFLLSVVVLHNRPDNSLISFALGIVLAFLARLII